MKIIQTIKRAARLAAVGGALVAFAPAAHSQQPSPASVAAAKELIASTGAASVFDPLIGGVIEQAKVLFLQQNPALGKDLNEISAKLRADLAPRKAELSNEMAQLYAARFTEPELKAILVFYQSPVGKKLLAQQPVVVDTSMKYAQDWANKLSDQVIGMMRAELKKRGHDQ